MSIRLGFAFVPTLAPRRLIPTARAVEAAGFDDLWVWEDCFKESAIAATGLALASTERITVGIGLMPVALRTVAITAMELATLEGAAPGRLIAGIGHGVLDWMGQVGVRADAPLTLLREYAIALRALLAGEEVSTEGRYVRLDRVRLDWPPAGHVPLMMGGGRPRTLRAVGELSDGLLIGSGAGLGTVRAAIGHIREGGAAEDLPVVASLVVATGPGSAERADRDLRLWSSDEDAAIGEGAIAGDAAAVAARIRAFEEAGVTTLVLQPTGDEPDLEGLIAWLGSEVAPLVR
jgi:5,10-methylenetetrahydromethanopterin reductase